MDVPTEVLITSITVAGGTCGSAIGAVVWWVKRQERRTSQAVADAIRAIQQQVNLVQRENERLRDENRDLRKELIATHQELRQLHSYLRDQFHTALVQVANALHRSAKAEIRRSGEHQAPPPADPSATDQVPSVPDLVHGMKGHVPGDEFSPHTDRREEPPTGRFHRHG